MTHEWRLATAASPEEGIATIRFLPTEAGSPTGTTEYEATAPSGEMWLTVVEEFLGGQDLDVFVGESLREGPHDRDLEQLQAALRTIPRQFPNLRILGLADPEQGAPPLQSAGVEAIKASVRERFVQAWSALPEAEQPAHENALKALLDPVARAVGEDDLFKALGLALETIKTSDSDFQALAAEALRKLHQDERDHPDLPPALRVFVDHHRTWLVEGPKKVH